MSKLSEAIRILKNLNQPDRVVKRNSVNFTKLMSILGSPHSAFKSIHITGTNGKGSVAIKVAKILQHAGYSTGIYTSPHLFSFRERIQVDGQLITREEFTNAVLTIEQISRREQLPFSYFEYITAVGFLHFKAKGCDYASIEVGVGGNNDTTNIITPQISVLTSIGLDHMDLLGPTKQHIAREKAGIIKNGRPVVLGPHAQGYSGIEEAIINKKCKDFRVAPSQFDHLDFESENNAIVRKCVQALRHCNPALKVTEEHVLKGLQARQPCRMQRLKEQFLPPYAKDKRVYFDVGHNPQAITKIKQYMKNHNYRPEDVTFVFGTSSKKKFDQSLAEIEAICQTVYLVAANHLRAMKIQQLQSYVGMARHPGKFRCISEGNIPTTLKYIMADPTSKVVVVVGSFFIMPEARGFFEPALLAHPQQNLNQIYQLDNKPIH